MSKETPKEGAVHSTETCPNCKDAGLLLETHASGEQVGSCGRCGYSFVRRILVNDKNEPLLDFNEKPQYVKDEVANPFGAIHIVDKEGNVQMYALATETQLEETIIPYIVQYREFIAEVTLSQWRFGKYEISDILKTLKPNDHVNSGQNEDPVRGADERHPSESGTLPDSGPHTGGQ